MKNVRLKCSLDSLQMRDRLMQNPEIVEIQLMQEDIHDPESIKQGIRYFQDHGIRVYLHHPMRYKNEYLSILSNDEGVRDFYNYSSSVIEEICIDCQVKCVIHAHYGKTSTCSLPWDRGSEILRAHIKDFMSDRLNVFLWEDTTFGLFSAANPLLVSHIIEPLSLPCVVDISHSFIALKGDGEKLIKHMNRMQPYARYFHVVDSMGGVHDSLPLGEGAVPWPSIVPFLQNKPFIFEINLKSYRDCTEMMDSVRFYNRLTKNKKPE